MAFFNLSFWMVVLSFGGIFAIFTLGLQVQVGIGGIPNFGHVLFLITGGYAYALLVSKAGWSFLPAALTAIAFSAALGATIAFTTLRLRPAYFAISILGVGEVARAIALNEKFTNGARGVGGYNQAWTAFRTFMLQTAESLGWTNPDPAVAMAAVSWILAGLVGMLLYRAYRSPWGRTVRAIREDALAASAVGKFVLLRRAEVVALGGAIGAISGVLYAFNVSHISPEFFEPTVTFLAYAMLVLGGLSSPGGAMLGSLLLSVIYAGLVFFSLPLAPSQIASLRMMIVGVTLLLIIRYRPQGLIGNRREMIFE